MGALVRRRGGEDGSPLLVVHLVLVGVVLAGGEVALVVAAVSAPTPDRRGPFIGLAILLAPLALLATWAPWALLRQRRARTDQDPGDPGTPPDVAEGPR